MIYLIAFLTFLPNIVLNQCGPSCAICKALQVEPANQICLSCLPNFFIINTDCLNCNECSLYGKCNECNPPSSDGGSNSNIIIYVISGGVSIAIIITLILCYNYRNGCTKPIKAPQIGRDRESDRDLKQTYKEDAPNRNIPKIGWIQSDKQVDQFQICSICLENQVKAVTKCNHGYHANCIWEWIRIKQMKCPMCKNQKLQPIKLFCSKCNFFYRLINYYQIPQIIDRKQNICLNCIEKQ